MAGGLLASERPSYGGALRVEIESGGESETEISRLIFETLTGIDGRGEVRPLLAETWERDTSMRRWKFHLRSGVRFHDGTPLTPASAVVALNMRIHPDIHDGTPFTRQNLANELVNADDEWRVTPTSDGLQIETPSPETDLPATLAQRKYILIRHSKENDAGTGPFKIESWNVMKHAALAANLEYWGGRPFLDSLDVEMGRAARDRMIDLEVGKAEVIELPAEMARRAGDEKIRVETTPAVDLLAVIFPPGRPASDNARLREAVSRAIDRTAIVNLVLQKQGEAAAGLLPQWISGTGFLFAEPGGPEAARSLVKEMNRPALVLGYDSADALQQSVAERIAVNAREAGIALTASPIAAPAAGARPEHPRYDARIVRVSLRSPLPRQALVGILADFMMVIGAEKIGLPDSESAEEIYAREKAVIETYRVVPIAHLPRVYGLGPRVRNWAIPAGAAMNGLPLADVWLEREAQ